MNSKYVCWMLEFYVASVAFFFFSFFYQMEGGQQKSLRFYERVLTTGNNVTRHAKSVCDDAARSEQHILEVFCRNPRQGLHHLLALCRKDAGILRGSRDGIFDPKKGGMRKNEIESELGSGTIYNPRKKSCVSIWFLTLCTTLRKTAPSYGT